MRKETSRLHLCVVAAIALAVCGTQPVVQIAAAAEAVVAPAEASSLDPAVQTRHAIAIDGIQLAYTATAGTMRLRLPRMVVLTTVLL